MTTSNEEGEREPVAKPAGHIVLTDHERNALAAVEQNTCFVSMSGTLMNLSDMGMIASCDPSAEHTCGWQITDAGRAALAAQIPEGGTEHGAPSESSDRGETASGAASRTVASGSSAEVPLNGRGVDVGSNADAHGDEHVERDKPGETGTSIARSLLDDAVAAHEEAQKLGQIGLAVRLSLLCRRIAFDAAQRPVCAFCNSAQPLPGREHLIFGNEPSRLLCSTAGGMAKHPSLRSDAHTPLPSRARRPHMFVQSSATGEQVRSYGPKPDDEPGFRTPGTAAAALLRSFGWLDSDSRFQRGVHDIRSIIEQGSRSVEAHVDELGALRASNQKLGREMNAQATRHAVRWNRITKNYQAARDESATWRRRALTAEAAIAAADKIEWSVTKDIKGKRAVMIRVNGELLHTCSHEPAEKAERLATAEESIAAWGIHAPGDTVTTEEIEHERKDEGRKTSQASRREGQEPAPEGDASAGGGVAATEARSGGLASSEAEATRREARGGVTAWPAEQCKAEGCTKRRIDMSGYCAEHPTVEREPDWKDHYARVASALGITYDAEGQGQWPGPIEAVLAYIEELKAAHRELLDAKTTAMQPKAHPFDRGQIVEIRTGKRAGQRHPVFDVYLAYQDDERPGVSIRDEDTELFYGLDEVSSVVGVPGPSEDTTSLQASAECPVCGSSTQHPHDASEIETWATNQVARWGYEVRLSRYGTAEAVEVHECIACGHERQGALRDVFRPSGTVRRWFCDECEERRQPRSAPSSGTDIAPGAEVVITEDCEMLHHRGVVGRVKSTRDDQAFVQSIGRGAFQGTLGPGFWYPMAHLRVVVSSPFTSTAPEKKT